MPRTPKCNLPMNMFAVNVCWNVQHACPNIDCTAQIIDYNENSMIELTADGNRYVTLFTKNGRTWALLREDHVGELRSEQFDLDDATDDAKKLCVWLTGGRIQQ